MVRFADRDAAARVAPLRRHRLRVLVATLVAAAATGGVTGALPPLAVDPATSAQIEALDCNRVAASDVRDALSQAPAPRIVALQGSLAPVTMQPFGEFLVAMGYPAERVRNPRDGSFSYASSGSADVLAGTLAWHYERDGAMPLLIGHSQGGMLAIRTLHALAGAFAPSIPVWNPLTDEAEARTTIVDPASGHERPVVGLTVPYAAALATGVLPRLLLGQWAMIPLLRKVPDTVVEFTGFAIPWDPIAGNFADPDSYVATGTAAVRNVLLPAAYSHIGLPRTAHLAGDRAMRAWVDDWTPATDPSSLPTGAETTNAIHAADIWHSVKRHWCRDAQRRLRPDER
ncbi:MAG: hypothetical protein ABI886_03995 [Betaproteobacteria bacterium]